MDLSKLSNEDLTALENKQYDKLSNEGLDFLHSQVQTQEKPVGPVATQPGAFGRISAPTTLPSNADEKAKQYVANTLPAIGGALGSAVGPEGTGLGAMLGGAGAAALGAGTGSMAKNLVSGDQSTPGEAVKKVTLDALLKGALPEIGGRVISAAGRGLRKAGDYAMQQAVGMKKYIPGVGETLADEGLIGTQGMLANQTEEALGRRGQEIAGLAKNLPEVSTDTPAQALMQRAQRMVLPDGSIRPENIEEYKQLQDLADRIMSKGGDAGVVSGEQAAAERAASGKLAKKAGAYRLTNPSEGMKAGMYGTEQGGWSQGLKDAYAAANPGSENALATADKAYGALSKADQALSTPESIPNSFGGLLHKPLPGKALVGSVSGRATLPLGRVMSNAPNNTIQALQILLSKPSGEDK